MAAPHSGAGKISIFWDLDNKPPRYAPHRVALNLRATAAALAPVLAETLAFANLHTFAHIPKWSSPPATNPNPAARRNPNPGLLHRPLICPLCGSAFPAKSQLKRHRRIHHNGERGHPRAALAGYGLGLELVRAGFDLRTVDASSQAADRAMKKQMRHAIESGVDWICIVSDDSGFSEILRKGRERGVGVVAIGDTPSLRICSDFWFAWDDVARGKLLSSGASSDGVDSSLSSDECRDAFLVRHSHENSCEFGGAAKRATEWRETEGAAQSVEPRSTSAFGRTDKYRAFYDLSLDFPAEEEEEGEGEVELEESI